MNLSIISYLIISNKEEARKFKQLLNIIDDK